jgi:hypothetical protein
LVRATRPVHLVEEVQQERNVRPLLAVSAPWNELTGIWPEFVPPTSSREAGLPGAVQSRRLASDITRYRSAFCFSSRHLTITLALQTKFPNHWIERLFQTAYKGND